MPRPVYRPRDAASRHLALDPDFAALIGRVGRIGLAHDRTRSPYEALVRAIAHQQVHARAAEAILGRFVALWPDRPFPEPADILALPDAGFRQAGFSAGKTAAIRDIAAHAAAGIVPTRAAAARLADAVLIERLIPIRGVGRWTVEMLLMFTLGRPDILPIDDFGVREGYRKLKSLAVQPRPKELAILGLAWAPYRSTAAWYLWRAAEEGRKTAQRPPPSDQKGSSGSAASRSPHTQLSQPRHDGADRTSPTTSTG